MGFGKKKKKSKARRKEVQTVQKVDMKHNPLYPPKKESAVKEVLSSLGVAAVCLILTGVIVSRFSYATGMDTSVASSGTVTGYEDQTGVDSSADTDDVVDAGDAGSVDSSEDVQETEDAQGTDTETMEQDGMTEDEYAQTQEADESRDYVISDSDVRRVSVSDLEGLSAEELSHARNEIYARHGRRFLDESLQAYFDSKDWYSGTIEPDQFSDELLSETEKANAETIMAYEKSKGYK